MKGASVSGVSHQIRLGGGSAGLGSWTPALVLLLGIVSSLSYQNRIASVLTLKKYSLLLIFHPTRGISSRKARKCCYLMLVVHLDSFSVGIVLTLHLGSSSSSREPLFRGPSHVVERDELVVTLLQYRVQLLVPLLPELQQPSALSATVRKTMAVLEFPKSLRDQARECKQKKVMRTTDA